MPRVLHYQVEDDHGRVLEPDIARERPAQFAARSLCSEQQPVVRVFRIQPRAPKRVQVFLATWSASAGKVLGCETYRIE